MLSLWPCTWTWCGRAPLSPGERPEQTVSGDHGPGKAHSQPDTDALWAGAEHSRSISGDPVVHAAPF